MLTKSRVRRCHARGIATQFSASHPSVELVRQRDRNQYYAGLLMPADARFAFFAVHAFNVETSLVREKTPRGQAEMGRLRLQWWREVVDAAYGGGAAAAAGARSSAEGAGGGQRRCRTRDRHHRCRPRRGRAFGHERARST